MKWLTSRSGSLEGDGRESTLALRSLARVREIDRRLHGIRVARWGQGWIVLPGMAVVIFVVAQRFVWSAIKLEHVIGGASMIFVAVASWIAALRDADRRADDLERERALLLRGTPDA